MVQFLIVDDDPGYREPLFDLIQEKNGAGHNVISAISGEDARHRLEQQFVDVAIIDLCLAVSYSRISGHDLCRIARESGIRAIAISCKKDELVKARREHAAYSVIAKDDPDFEALLLSTIDAVIALYHKEHPPGPLPQIVPPEQ